VPVARLAAARVALADQAGVGPSSTA